MVVEIRVHGVSGTPIESLLDDPWPQQVAGDDDGRIFRRTGRTSSGRVVEGYHWGRYTAGSPSRALWLLLVPFALVNVARFALLMPPVRRRRDRFADGVVRILGLVLTMTLVVTTCYLGWEVLARQCVPEACAGDFWLLDWFAGRSAGTRVLTGALLPIVLLAVLWQFDRLASPYDPPGRAFPKRPGSNGTLGDPGFWRGAPVTSAQRAAHVWTGCALTGLLALAMLGYAGSWAGQNGLFTAACAAVAAVLVAGLVTGAWVVVACPSTVAVSDGRDPTAVPAWMRRMRMATAAAALASTGLTATGLDHVLPAPPRPEEVGALFSGVANGVFALLGLMLLILLAVCGWLAYGKGGRALRDVPRPFRPFFLGMAAWVGAALGATVGLGMSAAAVFWTARALGEPVVDGADPGAQRIEVAAVYWIMAAVWGALTLVLVVSLLPLAAWLLRRKRWWLLLAALGAAIAVVAVAVLPDLSLASFARQAEWVIGSVAVVTTVGFVVFLVDRDGFQDRLCDDYTERAGLERARATVAARWRLALIRYRYHHVVGLLAVLGGLAVIVAAFGCAWMLVVRAAPPDVLMGNANGPLGKLGVLVVSFGATGLVVLGLGTWRKPGLRTSVGITWDLLSFWPRLGHPLCPPPYGGRAVLAVARRASQLATRDLIDGQPADRVVLSGHSQGSVITAAACAVIAERAGRAEARHDDGDDLDARPAADTLGKLHMITYGSQLQFLYARFFPSYFGHASLTDVHRSLGGRWRSVYRWTDPLGGPVLAWAAPSQGFGPDIARWHTVGCATDCTGHQPAVRCVCSPAHASGQCPYPKYWAVGSDLRFRDPATIEDSAYEPKRAARGHSGYPSDPAFELVVDDLLAGEWAAWEPCWAEHTTRAQQHQDRGRAAESALRST
jgi:hypothetical protein